MEQDKWNYQTSNDQGTQATLQPQFDATGDFSIQEDAFLQLQYSSSWVSVDFSFGVGDIYVGVNATIGNNQLSTQVEEDSFYIELNDQVGAESFSMDLSIQVLPTLTKSSPTLQSVSLCHRMLENIGPLTHQSWCQDAKADLVVAEHEGPTACDDCVSLKLDNADSYDITPNFFIEFETDTSIVFDSLSATFGDPIAVQNNLMRIPFTGTSDGPVSLQIGEITFNSETFTTENFHFFNICPIDAKDNSNPKPTTTTTTTTTTTEQTTSQAVTEPATGCAAEKDNFTWVGAKRSKIEMVGTNTVSVKVNMVQKPEDEAYSGFIIYSRKNCGSNFLKAIKDGLVSFDVMDSAAYYNTTGQLRYYHEAGQQTSAVIQFSNESPAEESEGINLLGNDKKDQFVLSFHGLQSIDFGNKGKF